ncbi:SoxR reducing system RseC family protein [Pseudidiomarina terrestris]|uniref:SoxR reducing system RseC family protein n=1 Tax=Pseudidiomarina terrestris TaxID=2820060 RepID=A0AAW7QVV8_9GAMM|nr:MULTISPECIES: SoxR reducing system RseC family protein [unclassified Pseudidiomarina]MDN7123582.1 SoxR reducing system RseC family protein [Pseudidiomarina sp. 1APP75-32.1]MDN7126628.1 SoxR reducing system RseC family protein [Pseudidiomarina sp. 1APR75-33.1]MDN7128694.1 SoxR reducing system RseC family protein [Pseudidiomarina sp. 1APR75-15]MDN7135047.1 SoxR reducing system RseC family protein [Pseudidiomarina sp. 1ASP75-5]MDN7137718.1 SoxR reducing system RseC family protein [Pseudidiomar
MIREIAIVQAIEADSLLVTTELKSGCSGCAQQSNCGAGIISKAFSDRRAEFRVAKPAGMQFKPGEQIELLLPEQMLTRASLLIYGVPLLALLGTALIAQLLLGMSEGSAILLSLVGFAGSFWGLKRWFQMRDVKVSQLLQVQQMH